MSLMLICWVAVLACLQAGSAKEQNAQVFDWPQSGPPLLRFTFGKFKQVGSVASQRTYVTETIVENLWNKTISEASFALYAYDKSKTRIGEGDVSVTNAQPGQVIRFQTTVSVTGTPATISLSLRYVPPELAKLVPARKISILVNSAPQAATLKVDGVLVGKTPTDVQVTVGKHELEFIKEGFDPGSYPIVIDPMAESGGSYTYEFGSLDHDTIELRDGTVLTGDLLTMTESQVILRIGTATRQLDRSQVKRIALSNRSMN
jgi:hypothetical protein